MTEFEKELVRFVSGYLDAGVSAEDYVKAFSQRLLDSIGRQNKSIGWSEKDTNILSHIILTLAGFMSEGESIDWLKELPHRIQRSESKMNEDLEKEIESFWGSFYRKETRKHSQINNDFRIVAHHFAQWQKEQMMKEAICYVAQPDTPIGNVLVPFIRIGETALSRYGIKVGDKVRIIIVKEDK